MKKLMVLLFAAGLVLGGASCASAIDFKAEGEWLFGFGIGDGSLLSRTNGGGQGSVKRNNEDKFLASQRIRLQVEAVASEHLSGTLRLQIGDQPWGRAANGDGDAVGGALGADGRVIGVLNAYIDWMPPETDLKVRMGLQGLGLPAFAIGTSQVFVDDVAAVTLSYRFNENVALTAFWARPYNDNYPGNGGLRASYMDNVDMGALVLPLTFDGVKVTPWFAMAGIGPNTDRGEDNWGAMGADATSREQFRAGMLPAWGVVGSDGRWVNDRNCRLTEYGTAWWAGIGGDITYWDPFRIAFDFAAGGVQYDKSRLNRAGWLASLLFEYKLDWGIPGLYGWYSSGDNSDLGDGSERLPSISLGNGKNAYSSFVWDGNPDIAREFVMGHSMAGTWGIGARLKDVSFLEDLKHSFRINYIGGTNKHGLLKKLHRTPTGFAANQSGLGVDSFYLTDLDSAMEFGLETTYKMYENFTVAFDASYIALWLDDSRKTWGHTPMNGRDRDVRDAWNLNVTFAYEF